MNEQYTDTEIEKDKIIAEAEQSVEELEPLITESVLDTGKYDPKIWTLKELMTTDFGPQDWLIDKLIPAQSITVISGDPESYKTWLTIEIAKSVAAGEPFLSKFNSTQMPVLFIDEENTPRLLKNRYQLLSVPDGLPISYLSASNFKISNSECMKFVYDLIKNKGVGLIVIDSLIRIHNGDENSARDMSRVYDELKKLRAMGLSVIVTHHHRKQGFGPKNVSQSMRGSSDILAGVDVHLAVSAKDKTITLIQSKLRGDEKMRPFNIEVKKGPPMQFDYVGEANEGEIASVTAKGIILSALEDEAGLDRKTLFERVRSVQSIGNVSITTALTELENEKQIKVLAGQHNKKHYSLADLEIDIPDSEPIALF